MSYSDQAPFNLPTSEETTAFRALDNVLRQDATLQSLGTLISSWRGEADDLAEPSAARPYIQLSPLGMDSDWVTEGQHKSPMSIQVRAVIAGTNSDTIMDFYGCIRRALFPLANDAAGLAAFQAVRAKMIGAGVAKGTLTRPAYAAFRLGEDGDRLLAATGSIELILLINT